MTVDTEREPVRARGAAGVAGPGGNQPGGHGPGDGEPGGHWLAELMRVQVGRIDERTRDQHADLRQRIDELGRRIEELRADQGDLAGAMLTRIDAHEEYHRANEHRWGLVKLAGRHPFRFAAVLTGALAGAGWIRPETAEWMADLLRRAAAW